MQGFYMKKTNEGYEIFIDGSSRGNPGPSGIGIVISKGDEVIKNISKYIGDTTNNIAEYSAFIYAIQEALVMHLDKVKINTDSELLYRQLKGIYRVRNSGIKPYYEQARHLMQGFKFLEINHISRKYNKGADKLAAMATDDKQANTLATPVDAKSIKRADKERWLLPT